MTAPAFHIGVCSWSLRPSSPDDLVQKAGALGIDTIQLALDPLRTGEWNLDDTIARFERAGLVIRSGMMSMKGEDYSTLDSIRATGGVRMDAHWKDNLASARLNAVLARQLGIGLVTFHAGFLPEEPEDPVRQAMVVRLRAMVDAFNREGVAVGFETGQESGDTLLAVLDEIDRHGAGINFDPANVILYDTGDPVEALKELMSWVRQIHIKDAVRTKERGTWGREVPVGQGEVDWSAFFDVLFEVGTDLDLMIEREAGEDRNDDIDAARSLVVARVMERRSEETDE